MMSKRGLNKFDTILLTNDGGKYSPSIRKLVCKISLYINKKYSFCV